VFIALGAAGYVVQASTSHFSFSVNSIEQSIARDSTEAAYNSLGTATSTFKSQTQACSVQPSDSALNCLEQADIAWADAIRTYGSALSAIPYPSSAQIEADAAQAAAGQAADLMTKLGDAPDGPAYSAISQNPNFRPTLDYVDSTYEALIQALGG
jgi:hypothetical protein